MTFLTEATSAPASVIASLLGDAARGISSLFAHASRYREYSRAEAQLMKLSDHELDDLGIGRSEIRARVWSDFDRG
jgi:uncharacterized protein YjiS (DUF1127 family)